MPDVRPEPSPGTMLATTAHALVGTTLADRFVLELELGRGGFGTVYAARDLRHGARVAVKVLRRPEAASVARFKRELRSLATIAHPNIVELYELVHDAGRYALAMELVPGVDLRSHVRGAGGALATLHTAGVGDARAAELASGPDGSRDERKLRAAVWQLVDGIEALHRQGVLHCDLKPSNVLVTPDGRVVIVDFGLVATTRGVDDAWSARRIGTPGYMAPEQIDGERPTEASDWYAFGALLFELWSGRLPFEGTASGILEAVRRCEAPALSLVCRDAPRAISELCAGLLTRDPAARPGAAEVRAALALGAPPAIAVGRERGPTAAPELFLGREAELAAVLGAWEQAAAGHPSALVVSGPSGIGKTALVRCFARTLEQPTLVVESACHPREQVPYGALDGIVECLQRTLADGVVPPAVAPDDLSALARVFPALASLIDSTTPAADGEPVALRVRAARAAAAVLTAAAGERPVMIVMDDLQWADRDSEGFLRLLLRSLPRALVLATYQQDDDRELGPLQELADDGIALRTLELPPLSETTAEELATALSGDALRGRDIARESTGHPFLVRELACAAPGATSAEAPHSLEALVGARLAALGPGPRRLLRVLAVAGGPIEEALATAAAECGTDGPRCVRALLARGIARTVASSSGEPRLAPYHAHFARVAVQGLARREVRGLHAVLARAIEARGSRSREDALAMHWLLAGEPLRAGPYAAAAAERAMRALAFERAAELYGVAAEHAEASQRHSELMALRGDALAHGGHGKQAAAAFLAAATTAPVGAAALALRGRAAEQLLKSGHLTEGMKTLDAVVRAAHLPGPARGAAGIVRLLAGRTKARVALALGGPLRDPAARELAACRAEVLWSASVGLGFVDPVAGAEYSSRFAVAAVASGDPARIVRALTSEAMVRVGQGEPAWSQVEALLARARRIAERHGDRFMLGRCEGAHGVAAALAGRFSVASRACAAAERLLGRQQRAASWELATTQHLALYASVQLGDFETVCRRAPELLREHCARDDRYAASGAATHYANLAWLAADGPVRAREVVRTAESWFPTDRFHLPRYDATVAHVHLDLYEGRPLEAHARTEALWRDLRRSLMLRVAPVKVDALFLRARALVAVAACDDRQRKPMLARAALDVARLARTRSLLGPPLALLVGAAWLHVCGLRVPARRRLARAIDALERVDARLLAAAARFELARLVGGGEGRALEERARATLGRAPLRDVAAFTSVFAPGFGR